MTALSWILPLVAVLLGIQSILADDEVTIYPRLKIDPDLKRPEKYMKQGESIVFFCTFEAKENDIHTKADNLKWTDEYGTEFDMNPNKPIHTKLLSGKKGRVLLLMVKADETWTKTFVCEADYGTDIKLKKNIKVTVLGKPTWKTEDKEVNGRVNEAITVDCSAIPSLPGIHIDTVIAFDNNTAMPEHYDFIESGTKLYIKSLTMAERNATFRCTALETHSAQDIMLEAKKIVKINLKYPPVFEQDRMIRYGIKGRKATFPCRVIDANPAVKELSFHKGNEDVTDNGDKYLIDPDQDQQMSTLTIKNLDDEDFGVDIFQCRATTSEDGLSNEMKYTLKLAVPPNLPEVAYKQSLRQKIVFEIKEVPFDINSENPPVTAFEIRRIMFSDIKHLNESDRREKLASLTPIVMNKTDSNSYIVEHLNSASLYTFEIRALNEAGHSDPFFWNATTLEPNAPEAMISSAPSVLSHWWIVSIGLIFVARWNLPWTLEVRRH